MSQKTPKGQAPSDKARSRKAPPIIPGRPKKKDSKLQEQALARVSALAHVRLRPELQARLVGEVALTCAWVESAHLAVEPFLHELMWVEYRYMGPWQRTERFAKEYAAAYLRGYARHFGAEDLEKKRPVADALAACSPDEINALHHARAHADALGVPYDIYCDVVIEGHVGSDKWEQPPRPNQMFGKLTAARLRGRPSRDEVSERLLLRHWDGRFFADDEDVDSVREAAWKMLREAVHAASDPAECLSDHLRVRRSINETRARRVFGNGLVDEAIALGGAPAPWRFNEVPLASVRSCYGYPGPAEGLPCRDCPIREGCVQVEAAAREELVTMTGCEDPRKQRKRELNRLRQQRHRDRKRQGVEGAG